MMGNWVKKGKDAMNDTITSLKKIIYEDPSGRKFQVKKTLSEDGRFGQLFVVEDVTHEYTGTPARQYALKSIPLSNENSKQINKEIKFMKILSGHKNIVKLETSFTSVVEGRKEAIIVMELCPGGSLLDILNKRLGEHRAFTETELLTIFMQVCEAVGHMHGCVPPIAHRDIKLENVLRGERGFKLCDFGSATAISSRPISESDRQLISDDIDRNTTLVYRAPEMIDLFRKQLICEKVDIWALGCLLYKMAFGCDAFEEGGLQILNNKWSVPKHSPYSKDLTDLISFMLVQDPIARPHIGLVTGRVAALLKKPNPLATFKPYDHSTGPAATNTSAKVPVHPMSTLRVSSSSTSSSPTPQTPPPSNNNNNNNNNGGGGDLFSMLEWEQDAPGQSGQQGSGASGASGGFDFFGGQSESTFVPAVSASPVPAAATPQGSYDFFADFGGSNGGPAAATPTPTPTPIVTGQSVSPALVGSGAPMASSTPNVSGSGNSFFDDDNNSFFNAAPVLQPQPVSASPKPQQPQPQQKQQKADDHQLKKSADEIKADVYSNWLK